MKRLIVIGLLRACEVLDKLPMWTRRWYGCELATLSAKLDDRWGTQVWEQV